MRVISATRNVRIIDDRAVETVEVVVSIEGEDTSGGARLSSAARLAEDAADEIAPKVAKYVPTMAHDPVVIGTDDISFLWLTGRKP